MAYRNIIKNAPGYAWLAGSVTAGLISLYPHTLGLEQFKDRLTSWSKGKPDAVDNEILLLAEEIKRDLKWHDSSFLRGKSSVSFIQTKQIEFYHQGSTATRWGGVIGVPAFFSSKSLEMAEENPDVLLLYNMDLKTEEGQRIFNTYKLSRAAKKFALAKEMCQLKSNKVYFDACGLSVTVMGCYAMAQTLSQLLPFRGSVVLSYLIVIPILSLSYLKATDLYNCYNEASSDKQAAKINKEVADGGIEYFAALLARKDAIDSTQKKLVNNAGIADSDQAWRKAELTLTERKDRLVQSIQKLYEEKYTTS